MPQPLIFQFICMQLCKNHNCFLKIHSKQLNQYCCNFIIFYHNKNVLKNGLGCGLGRGLSCVDLQKKESRVNLFLLWVKKIVLGSGQVRKFWSVLPYLILTYYFFCTIYNRENQNCGKKLSINFLNQYEM